MDKFSRTFKVQCLPDKGTNPIVLYVVVMIVFSVIGELAVAEAQLMGERAEMDRLEVKAEEAIGNGDPNGATLAIGRAALMASVLAKRESHPQTKLIYGGAEALFRAQENAYRALALYEQAGGQRPAPSGVCQLLSLAEKYGVSATKKLVQATPLSEKSSLDLHHHLTEKTQEWAQIIQDSQADFSCT